MRFRWQKRADEERVHRIAAQTRQANAVADWPKVQHHADVLRREKELNGWTEALVTIFGTHRQPEEGRG